MDSPLTKLKRDRTNSKSAFTRKCTILEESIHRGDPYENLVALNEEMSAAFVKLETHSNLVIEMLSLNVSEGDDAIKDAENYILTCERRKVQLSALVVQRKKCPDNSSSTVKVKSLPPPQFSGDIRNYGTFKSDFERLIRTKYGDDPYALVNSLQGDALECVRGVEDNFVKMFERLDHRFGNPCRVTESIIKDLKELKPIIEGDTKRFIKAVNVIERAYLDMAKIGLQNEMNTTSTVTLVESILPRNLKHDWVKEAEELSDKSLLFKNLLEDEI